MPAHRCEMAAIALRSEELPILAFQVLPASFSASVVPWAYFCVAILIDFPCPESPENVELKSDRLQICNYSVLKFHFCIF